MKKLEEVYKKWEKKSAGGKYAAGSSVSNGMQSGGDDWVRKYGYFPQAGPTRRPARSRRKKQRVGWAKRKKYPTGDTI